MKPDFKRHNPDPRYLRDHVARTGLTQEEVAARLGVSPRAMRSYLSLTRGSRQDAPYPVQFALEALSGGPRW